MSAIALNIAMDTSTDARSLFRPLLPMAVRLAEMAPERADPGALHADELRMIERAVPKRRQEFAAGRQLAHRLLADAGHGLAALGNDSDRVPEWPSAVIGSITHCHSLCAVAIAPRTIGAGLGLDVEPAVPLKQDLLPQILRESERARIDAWPEPLRALAGLMTFSAKEAAYKALYPARRVFLDFQDVELAWSGFEIEANDAAEAVFEAHVRVPHATWPGMSRIVGRARLAHGHVGTAVLLPTV